MVSVQASDNVSENEKRSGRLQTTWGQVCVCVFNCVCVCVYLQVVVVSLAAAVELLGDALVQVENRAEITEKPWCGDHELLTWRWRRWNRRKKCDKTFLNKIGVCWHVCVSPRGLLGLNAGSLKSGATRGDWERDRFASGPTSSLLRLLTAKEEKETTIYKSFDKKHSGWSRTPAHCGWYAKTE